MNAVALLVSALVFCSVSFIAQSGLNLLLETRRRTGLVTSRLSYEVPATHGSDRVMPGLMKTRQVLEPGDPFTRWDNFLTLYLSQAGLRKTPAQIYLLIGGATLVVLIGAVVLGRPILVHGVLITVVGFFLISLTVVAALVSYWVVRARRIRLRAFESQMPIALDVIVRSLRAGHPAISAVRLASSEMGEPIGPEFARVVDETTYGAEFRDALFHFAQRTGSEDAHFFSVSVGIQAETGGNLAEALEGLSQVIRSRLLLAKRIKALSAEGRASAVLLSVLPVLLVAFMLAFHPNYYSSKFSDPIFWPGVAWVTLEYLLGLFMIRRITRFRY